MVMNLVGGLVYPKAAVALMVAYCVGSFAYLKGYSDTSKDVKGARYTNPLAPLKPPPAWPMHWECPACTLRNNKSPAYKAPRQGCGCKHCIENQD